MADSPIVDSDAVPWTERAHGDFFAVKCRRLGPLAGSEQLACNMFELLPGKTAMPFHRHLAIEEALFVLAGNGTLRLGESRHAVSPGDYVAFVAGGPAHQLTNTGGDPLRYLVLSTCPDVDAVVYPDSKKIGIGAKGRDPVLSLFREEAKVDYWDREPTGDGKRTANPGPGDGPDPDDDAPDDAPDDDSAIEQRIDDEIAELKKKLGLSGKARAGTRSAGASGGAPPRKRRTVVDATLAELERLKRSLDGD